jgi:Icc-related predicted phosphoesterase
LVFVGDIDLDPEAQSFRQWLEPVYKLQPKVQVAWIPGNHDSDQEDRWQRLQDCGPALPLHGRVIDMNGVRVGGLGGVFMGRVWRPPEAALVPERRDVAKRPLRRHERLHPPQPGLHTAIYEAEWIALGCQGADILITHEAPSCHEYGFEALNELARALRVVRAFHGHHHDDHTAEYLAHRERMGFEAVALSLCAIKTAGGERVASGRPDW